MRTIFFFVFALTAGSLLAQDADILWQQNIGGSSHDFLYSLKPTPDNGFIFAGKSSSSNGDAPCGSLDAWIIKLDISGNIDWYNCYGGINYDQSNSAVATSDGGYIFAGATYSDDVPGHHPDSWDGWVVKLDNTGNIQWQKCLGGYENDMANAVVQTYEGGYFITGYTESDGTLTGTNGGADYWVVKLDNMGNTEWEYTYGGNDLDMANDGKQTADSGFIVTGYTFSNNHDVVGFHGEQDIWVLKLTKNGTLEWSLAIGGANSEESNNIFELPGGGYVLSGHSNSNNGDITGGHGNRDFLLVKLTSDGNIDWYKTYGSSSAEFDTYMHPCYDGGFLLTGFSAGETADGDVPYHYGPFPDGWIGKTDANGSLLWSKTLGGTGEDNPRGVLQTFDNAYVMYGNSNSYDYDVTMNHGASDGWIIKLDPLTGITESKNINKISLYPNPSDGTFTLQGLEPGDQVQINNNLAQEVYLFKATGNTREIKVQLPAGIYICTVVNKDKLRSSLKMVIN